jgi:hypothetical protein
MQTNIITLNGNHLIPLTTPSQAFLKTILDALPHYILTFSEVYIAFRWFMCYIKIQKSTPKFHLCLELTMKENIG